jgi:hypothetical protein
MPSTSVVETNTGRVINVDQVHPNLPLLYDEVLGTWHPQLGVEGIAKSANYVWDTGSLSWVVMTQPSGGGGGGGGGAVTVANGADVALGSTTDTAVTSDAAGTVSGKLRGLVAILADVWDNANNLLRIGGTVSVDNFPASQTVNGTVAISNLAGSPIAGKQVFVYKVGTAPEAAGVFYCWAKDTGSPGAWAPGTPGLNGRATDGTLAADAGCLRIPNPTLGGNYLSQCSLGTTVACFLNIFDFVWVNSGLVVTTTTAQAITSVAFPARDAAGTANGQGFGIGILVTTATTNAAAIATITINYTNQAGTPGRTATISSFPATAVIGTVVLAQLQAGDTGVRSIQGVTLGTSLVAGAISLFVYSGIISQSSATPNAGGPALTNVLDPGPRLYNGVCLLPVGLMSGTVATTLVGTIIATER